MTDVKNMLASDAEDTENYIKGIFESGLCGSTRLREAAEYSLLGGGKRIRAALAIEFCRMFGGDTKSALPFAAAIEMIHAFSLVHDDMPCMDNDDMRRGKPSCHKAYGEAEALLCGDELRSNDDELVCSGFYGAQGCRGICTVCGRARYDGRSALRSVRKARNIR